VPETTSDPAVPRTVGDEADRYLATVQLVQEVLGLDALDAASLHEVARLAGQARANIDSIDRITRQLQERQSRIAELEDGLAFYKELYDDEQLDGAIALQHVARLADENRWLRGRLATLSDHDAAYGLVPEDAITSYPDNFADLLSRIPDLRDAGIVYTGTDSAVLELDEYDTLNKLVRVAWDSLRTLGDYVRARGNGKCEHGVAYYLEHTPDGYRSLAPKKFAERETAVTMNAWGELRRFRAPPEVDPSEMATMEAHFKLGRVGMISPRLYFLDCWPKTGKVYVGYVGAHLRNTKTN
jgi:hypothetical protein